MGIDDEIEREMYRQEDVALEMNRELGGQEHAEIARRVKRALERRQAERAGGAA